jgi:ethanolamine transporter EutH
MNARYETFPMTIMVRRLVIISLLCTLFAIGLVAVVETHGRHGRTVFAGNAIGCMTAGDPGCSAKF